jgi:FkbM family methyltransferase
VDRPQFRELDVRSRWENTALIHTAPLRRNIRTALLAAGSLLQKLAVWIYRSPQEKRVIPWFSDNGDKIHRLDYDLSRDSLVLDLGGYEGQWASDIFARYCCRVFVFEPVPEYACNIKRRFEKNSSIRIFQFGLSNETRRETLSICGDGSSAYRKGANLCEISLVKALDFFKENHIARVDLVKINIEGGEYDLLEHLIAANLVRSLKNIQVQFHDFVPHAELRMKRIQDQLKATHSLTYQYPFVWENWVLDHRKVVAK